MIPLLLSGAMLSAAPLPAPPTLDPQAGTYQGDGFSQALSIDGLDPGQVAQIEVGAFASFRGYPDLALRLDDGRVFVNPDTIAYGGYQKVSGAFSITSMATIPGAEDSQLLMTDGSTLLRLSWTDLKTDGSARSLNPVGPAGISLNSAKLLPSDSDLLLLNGGGASCLILEEGSGGLAVKNQFAATALQGKFHDARLVNCSSDSNRPDQVAVITDTGLEVLEQDGSLALFNGSSIQFTAAPAGAELSVLRADQTGSGRDFLLWKFSFPAVGDMIAVLNSGHIEWVYTVGLGLADFQLAAWETSDGLGNLVLPIGVANSIWFSHNTGATDMGQSVFALDSEAVSNIDLGLLSPGEPGIDTPLAPALVRCLDMNVDGSSDLVILDSQNHLCILPGTKGAVIHERSSVVMHVDPNQYMDIHIPANGGAGLNYSLWWQEDLTSEAGPEPIASDTLTKPNPSTEANFVALPYPLITDGIYTILLEPFDAQGNALPPTAILWASDPTRNQEMHDIATETFPWGPAFEVPVEEGTGEDGPNGTTPVPRPRVNPLPCPEGGC